MGGWAYVLVAGVMIAWIGQVRAEPIAPPSSCRFEPLGAGVVRSVTDGRNIVLDDGREIRLDAIEVPQLPAEDGTPHLAAGLAARTILESILKDQKVDLRGRGTDAVDRYGRIMTYVHVAGRGGASAAHEMLARGYARVGTRVGDQACATELLARERAARQAKLGLWGKEYYAIVGADSGAALLTGRGRFAVVEGKVLSVRESGGTIYMNFGRRWSQALTVTILKRHERIFTAAGFAPRGLENRHVRVRGWIEERNGPRIEALSPEQIEIAERN
jgi:endonuclease YncB( thermonuclease family)